MAIDNYIFTIRTLKVLNHLGIKTMDELKTFKLPNIGDIVFKQTTLKLEVRYTQKIDNEIKTFLNKIN
jgi:hypothetical protein